MVGSLSILASECLSRSCSVTSANSMCGVLLSYKIKRMGWDCFTGHDGQGRWQAGIFGGLGESLQTTKLADSIVLNKLDPPNPSDDP